MYSSRRRKRSRIPRPKYEMIRASFHFLNLKNQLYLVRVMKMKTREEIFSIFRSQEEELVHRGVEKIAVFGSVARGEATSSSDVDILVEFNRPVGLFEFVRLKMVLEEWLGCQVDLVTPDALHPMLRDRILEEAIYVREENRA